MRRAGPRGACFALLASLAQAGCSLGGPLAGQAVDYNSAIEQAANTLLVRNILRARDQAPLHFSTVPQIRGSISVGIGQPGLAVPFSAAATALAGGIGATALNSPSFDVAALDTQEFTRGLLEPLEPQLLKYFWDRGVPRELLLLLFLDSIDLPGGEGRALNDPRCLFVRPDCPDPRHGRRFLDAMRGGLRDNPPSFDSYTALTPIGPVLSAAQAADPSVLAELADGKIRMRQVGPGRHQLYRTSEEVAICGSNSSREAPEAAAPRMAGAATRAAAAPPRAARGRADRARADRAPAAPSAASAPEASCVTDEVVMRPDGTISDGVAGDTPRLHLRSVDDVLRYLGALQAVQDQRAEEGTEPACLDIRLQPLGMAGPGGDRAACLFDLRRAGRPLPPVSPAFRLAHRGEDYVVPGNLEPSADSLRRGDYTLRVLALLTQLINIKKASNSLPTTRAVQLVR
jgi:hypothetical protein